MEFKVRLFLGDELIDPSDYDKIRINCPDVDRIVNEIYERNERRPLTRAELDALDRIIMETAGKSGIPPSEIRTLTKLESDALLRAACRAGEIPSPSTAKLYMKYRGIVREVEARGKTGEQTKEAADGDQG